VVTKAVDAEFIDQVGGRDLVEAGLAHLLAADQQEAMDGDVDRRIDARRHQHRRPVHAVEPQDVLADQVVHRRPPGGEPLVVLSEADGGDVVDERVVPDVGDMRRVPGQRDAPRDRRAADREVVESTTDEPQRLVALALGTHEAGMRRVPVEQRLLEARQLEEVVLFLHRFDRTEVDRAQPVDQVAGRVVRLA
jgi:hypothetical protein